MKKLLFLFITLTASSALQSQPLLISDLINYSNTIPSPYNINPPAIDNLVLSQVQKGFILSSFYDSVKVVGATTKSKSFHLLTNTNTTDSESIRIYTSTNDGSGYTNSCIIRFTSTNFATYKKWINDITALAGYVNLNLNSSGQYLYKNTSTGKTVTVGISGIYTASGGTGISSQNWKADSPVSYYCDINYH